MKLFRKSASVMIIFTVCISMLVSPYSAYFAYADGEQNAGAEENLPFTFEETNYGVAGNEVTAHRIKLTEDTASFIGEERDNEYYGLGCVMVSNTEADGSKMYYLIGRNGLVTTFESKDGETASFYQLNEYEEDLLEYYPDDLYVIKNPETGLKDVYNATKDKYYTIGAKSIDNDSNNNGYYKEAGLITYTVSGNMCGLLKNTGEKLTDPVYVYTDIISYANCVACGTETGYRHLWRTDTDECLICKYFNSDGIGVYAVSDGGSFKFLNYDTLEPVTDASYTEPRINSEMYLYNGEYYFFDHYNNHLVSKDGLLDLDGIYPGYSKSYDSIFHGIRLWKTLSDDTKAKIMTVQCIWLSPDGKEEYKNETFTIDYGSAERDPANYDYHYLTYYYRDVKVRYDGKYVVLYNDIPQMSGEQFDYVESRGKYLICRKLISGDVKYNNAVYKYYFYNYIDHEVIDEEGVDWVTFGSGPTSKYEDLAILMKDSEPGSYGILDLETGTTSFSGYIFEAPDFDKARDSITVTGRERFEDNGWVAEISYTKDARYGGTNVADQKVINSDFKIIDEDATLCDVHWGDTLRIVTSQYNEENREKTTHIFDFNGKLILNRNDIIQHDLTGRGYDHMIYRDAYTTVLSSSRYGLVSNTNREILPSTYSFVGNCRNGYAYFETEDSSENEIVGIVDTSGNKIINAELGWLSRNTWQQEDLYRERANMYRSISFKKTNAADNDTVYLYYYDGQDADSGQPDEEKPTAFKSNDKKFGGDFGYYYSDSYFGHSAKTYDHSLATMSLCLAFSAYGDTSDLSYKNYDKNVKAVLEGCGFTGENFENYKEYSFNMKPTSDSIGCAMGSKKLSDGTTLIAVAVRGGGYESEWSSNLDVGHTGDHYGFDDAANKVCGYLTDYINEKPITGLIKIWITGYSRAGATATQAAAMLDRGEVEGVSIDNTNIYAYGFATPMGAIKDSDPSNPIYDNIFSIINYHDIVPLVAPENWGFGRYGKTYIFPYKTSTWESDIYERGMVAYLKKMGCQYELYNFTTFSGCNDSLGLFMRKFIDSFAKNIGIGFPNEATGRISYRLRYQNDFKKAIGSGMLGGNHLELGLGIVFLISDDNVFSSTRNLILKQTGLNSKLSATAINNFELLYKAHLDQRYYLAWMQSMDENYVSDAHCRFMSGNGRVIKIKCPVDVHVMDNEGNLVASIIDEEPWQDEEASVIASIDENGQKTVYLPIDAEYSITVTAREDCDVIYTVEETTASTLEPVRVTNYNIDNLAENEEIIAEVGKYPDEEIEQPATEASSAEYEVFKDGQALDPSLELNDPAAIESHTYTVTTEFNEEEGSVYGIGQYVEGSEVILTAESNPGYTFDGFYLDGNKLTDEDLDNDSSTVQLLITDNVNIQAKFVKNAASPERLEWEKFYVEMDPGDQKQVAVNIYPEDAASAELSYETSDANVVTVEQGLLTAVGPGSAIVTVKAYNGITADLIVVVNDPNKPKDITGAKIYLEYDKITYSGSYKKPWIYAEKDGYYYDNDYGDFAATYKNNKNVGTATVTIKGIDGYTGTASKTFTIVPKGTTISKLAKAKKGFTVKWKRQAAKMSVNRITGYQIRYSLKPNMKSAKTVTVKGYKATSKKISKLKAKKKYYVQIRTYMKVGKKTYYSAWSKTKQVKTK